MSTNPKNKKLPCIGCITFPVCLSYASNNSITWLAHLANKCSLLDNYLGTDRGVNHIKVDQKLYEKLFDHFGK